MQAVKKLVTTAMEKKELLELRQKKQTELMEEELKIKTGKVEDSSLRKKIRRDLARIMTALSKVGKSSDGLVKGL